MGDKTEEFAEPVNRWRICGNLECARDMMKVARRVGKKLSWGLASMVLWTSLQSLPTFATVIEFDDDGNATVKEKKTELASLSNEAAVSEPNERRRLQELSRTIAVRFSGEPGVRKAGLDALAFVEVFEALIAAESDFNPKAVSEKGAVGLGQLMPGTASELNVKDPFDPVENLVGSARYLSQQLLEFGTLELALAAYNAGPERVKQYDGVPPFPETKAYVASILKDAGIQTVGVGRDAQPPEAVPINSEQHLQGDVSVWEF